MALFDPCPKCQGLGHVCKDEDPLNHVHEHDKLDLCKTCGGRGLVPAKTDDKQPEE